MMKSIVLLTGLAGVIAVGAAWYVHETADQPSTFRTVSVERGNLLATINATAVIEAEEVVDVGAQIAGMVQAFGHDLKDPSKNIDYGSHVEVGTVLAQIDPALYKASLHQAQANLDNSLAMLEQAKTNLKLSQLNWDRAQTLHERKVMTQADYDSSQADLETKKPALAAAQAAVEQAKANLETAQTNLKYCTITSPVKGVIVDRRVNMGQTVVSSLSAPSLFLIARDLTRMQLWASVNEADIGQIHPGQPVQFTVDAFPNTTFRGEVSQIRLNANMTQNVVTYTVVVTTDNSSGRLLPYMTANVKFEVAKRDNVLLVPSAALRWKPQPNQVVADAREAFAKSSKRRGGRPQESKSDQAPKSEKASPGSTASKGEEAVATNDESASKEDSATGDETSESKDTRPSKEEGASKEDGAVSTKGDGRGRTRRGDRAGSNGGQSGRKTDDLHKPRKAGPRREKPTIWIDEDGFARPLRIETGLTDGTQVEVVAGELKEGAQIIVGEVRREGANETKNPFLPTFFGRGGRPTSGEKDKGKEK
ncbi:MAG TPA: efflux RND transporter periplasmic adaptor subunit [Planctomycetaceae bacterium]|jgi:HlyD family secretion protein|nr:efflux RND transporter periplasmic adaptor subunit [Planctomycetaceae bacterium]